MRRSTAWFLAGWLAAMLLGCSGAGGTDGSDLPGDLAAVDLGAEDPGGIHEVSEDEDRGEPRDPGAGEAVEDAGGDREAGNDLEPVPDPGAGDPGKELPEDPGQPEDSRWDPGAQEDPGEGRDPGGGGDPASETGSGDPGGEDPGPGPFTVRIRPARPEDVVASYLMSVSPTAWNLFGGESLPLGRHFDSEMGHVGYHSALRFPGLAIPQGARVLAATLSFLPTNEVDSSNILWLAIHAEKAPDSPPLSLTDDDRGRPDQRLQTDAGIDQWVIRCNASCTDLTEYDCPQRKRDCWDRTVRYQCPKDLKALVQEVVDLPGWQSGNALTLILEPNVPQDYQNRDTGARHIVGVEEGRPEEDRPLLEVTWELP